MSESPVLLDATRDGVAVVTLNRPQSDNTFNPDVIGLLSDVIEEVRGADGVRCVILEAAGENFSSGDDLSWARFEADYSRDDHFDDAKAQAALLQGWRTLPKLTLSLVQGAAIGTAAGLVAGSDIAFTTQSASFSFPDVRRGFVPAVLMPFIVEALGMRATRRFLLTGAPISANEALRLGLVHAVVADRQGLATASEEVVSALYETAPGAFAAAKALIAEVDREPIDQELLSDMCRDLSRSLVEDEAKEGFAAILGGRRPSWGT